MNWIAAVADWVRGLVAGQQALASVNPYVQTAPDWALVIPAPVLALGLLVWTVGSMRRSADETAKTLRAGAAALSGGLIKDTPKPANEDQVKALERRVQDLTEAQRLQISALSAQLDAMNQRLHANGQAALMGIEEKAKRDQAVAEIVAENSAGAKALEASVMHGEELDLETLKTEARADTERAAEKWRRIAALSRGVKDGEALAAYAEAHRLQPEDFWTCVELSRLYHRWKGDLAAARAAAEASERAAYTAREHAVAKHELGEVLVKSSDLVGAQAAFEAYAEACEALARENPNSHEALRDLSIAYNKLGDLLKENGDPAGALVRYGAALEVRERLARENPTSSEVQRDLSVSYERLGDALRGSGDRDGAKVRYEAGLDIRERLVQENPNSAISQRDLSVSYERLGDLLKDLGDGDGARTRYEAGLAVRERLAQANPNSVEAQRDVWVLMWRFAQMPDGGITWAQVCERLETMKARGVLAPRDDHYLDQARANAANSANNSPV